MKIIKECINDDLQLVSGRVLIQYEAFEQLKLCTLEKGNVFEYEKALAPANS
jgi:hypothetical protein